ncbi:MAG: altronate dehydratase large subunit [Clostridia bacterium]|jgi:altronate dehydratase|nr:altronate dehydratase large subunit [Clostridia bacterium]MDN5323146.1 altronate dehydratase large subunit [Clostridia bacterium]
MVRVANKQQREPINIEEIILGTECGGSDTTSGLAANPAVGAAMENKPNQRC